MADRNPKPLAEAATRAARVGAVAAKREPARAVDVFAAGLRRRGIVPLLVLHLLAREPAYGNRLIESISALTEGVLTVNPNTMYPLLRELESGGLIEGRWEHPEKRSRRYYSVTVDGETELARLRDELAPFLDAVVRSATLMRQELYEQ